MYEGSFSTRFSDFPISADSFVCAESVSAGVELRSVFSLSIDPFQLINIMVSIIAIILNFRQVRLYRSEKCFEVASRGDINLKRDALPCWVPNWAKDQKIA
jgi:hypothetical protein